MELQVESWTPSARVWLDETTEARVLHLFQDVCNLINSQDQILSVIDAGVDRTAFCLRLRPLAEFADGGGFVDLLDAADSARAAPDSIRIGGLVIEIGEPEIWDPVPNWKALRSQGSLDADSRGILQAKLEHESPPGGLTGLAIRHGTDGNTEAHENETLIAARPAAARMATALQQRNPGDLKKAAYGLAGLGAGLTPSGDDFLVGTLHALWSALPEGEAGRLGRPLVEGAKDHTTALSGAWLEAAGRGEAAEHWHDVFVALEAGDLERLKTAASRLLRVGHSSGADSLAGFLAARAALNGDDLSLN